MVIKSEPVACLQPSSITSTGGGADCCGADSSLEELLDDYTFDYYNDIQELEESSNNNNNNNALSIVKQQQQQQPLVNIVNIKQEEESGSQGHALLRQCLRPAPDDYQQQRHLQFLNQIGSAIAALPPHPQQQQQQEMSIKTEKPAYWNGNNNSNPNTAQGLASVLSLVMEQVNEEVRSTCEILGVSASKSSFFCFLLLVVDFRDLCLHLRMAPC